MTKQDKHHKESACPSCGAYTGCGEPCEPCLEASHDCDNDECIIIGPSCDPLSIAKQTKEVTKDMGGNALAKLLGW